MLHPKILMSTVSKTCSTTYNKMVVEHCDTTTVTMHAVLQENKIMKAAGYVDNYFIQHVPLTHIEDVFFTNKNLCCLATSIEGRMQSLSRALRHLRCFLELAFDRHGFSTIFVDPCPLLWRHPIGRAGGVMT